MRELTYRKKQSLKNRRRMISVNEHTEDTDCKTHVRKSFVYIVRSIKKIEKPTEKPDIYIHKAFDSKTNEEKFSFRVKGAFYMENKGSTFLVDFCHTLKIDIQWKNKVFSPNKSATLT